MSRTSTLLYVLFKIDSRVCSVSVLFSFYIYIIISLACSKQLSIVIHSQRPRDHRGKESIKFWDLYDFQLHFVLPQEDHVASLLLFTRVHIHTKIQKETGASGMVLERHLQRCLLKVALIVTKPAQELMQNSSTISFA